MFQINSKKESLAGYKKTLSLDITLSAEKWRLLPSFLYFKIDVLFERIFYFAGGSHLERIGDRQAKKEG
jgi:hypothetical protein